MSPLASRWRPSMARAKSSTVYEGLKLARLFMVLSSLAPLFILWAIRGNSVIPDRWFIVACTSMAVVPGAVLYLRLCVARSRRDVRELVAGTAEDHRNHVLVYLFAILLPFYRQEVEGVRDLAAMVVALVFIVFLFWRLNLHYMNLFFALMNYRVFTVSPPQDENRHTGREPFVFITRRRSVLPGDRFVAYRLSDTVYLE